jgi:hypothetical protein
VAQQLLADQVTTALVGLRDQETLLAREHEKHLQLAVKHGADWPLDWPEKFYAWPRPCSRWCRGCLQRLYPHLPTLGLTWHRGADGRPRRVTPAQARSPWPHATAPAGNGPSRLPRPRRQPSQTAATSTPCAGTASWRSAPTRAWQLRAQLCWAHRCRRRAGCAVRAGPLPAPGYDSAHLAGWRRWHIGRAGAQNQRAFEDLQQHERKKRSSLPSPCPNHAPTWDESFGPFTELLGRGPCRCTCSRCPFDAPDCPRAYSFEQTATGQWVPLSWARLSGGNIPSPRPSSCVGGPSSGPRATPQPAHRRGARALAARYYLEGVVREHYGIRSSLVVAAGN